MIAGRFIDPPRVDCREVLRRPAYTSKQILTTKGPGEGKSSFVSFGAAIEKYKAREGVERLGEREHLQVDHNKPIWCWSRCQHNDVITRVQWRPSLVQLRTVCISGSTLKNKFDSRKEALQDWGYEKKAFSTSCRETS